MASMKEDRRDGTANDRLFSLSGSYPSGSESISAKEPREETTLSELESISTSLPRMKTNKESYAGLKMGDMFE